MLKTTQDLSLVDYFFEHKQLMRKLDELHKQLEGFSDYLPTFKVNTAFSKENDDEDYKEKKEKLKEDILAKLNANLQEIDTELPLANYEFITKENGNDKLAEIYKVLGPMNFQISDKFELPSFWSEYEKEEERQKMNDERLCSLEWQHRKSGAIFRGEYLANNGRPDGRGLKVFKGNSLYEGWFEHGLCHGYGRAISSKGEYYQGFFDSDSMHGKGFFVWPDGRIYEGQWLDN